MVLVLSEPWPHRSNGITCTRTPVALANRFQSVVNVVSTIDPSFFVALTPHLMSLSGTGSTTRNKSNSSLLSWRSYCCKTRGLLSESRWCFRLVACKATLPKCFVELHNPVAYTCIRVAYTCIRVAYTCIRPPVRFSDVSRYSLRSETSVHLVVAYPWLSAIRSSTLNVVAVQPWNGLPGMTSHQH